MLEAETSALYKRVADVRRQYRRSVHTHFVASCHLRECMCVKDNGAWVCKRGVEVSDGWTGRLERVRSGSDKREIGDCGKPNGSVCEIPRCHPPPPALYIAHSYRMGAAKGVRSETLGRITEAEARTTPVAQLAAFLRTQVCVREMVCGHASFT